MNTFLLERQQMGNCHMLVSKIRHQLQYYHQPMLRWGPNGIRHSRFVQRCSVRHSSLLPEMLSSSHHKPRWAGVPMTWSSQDSVHIQLGKFTNCFSTNSKSVWTLKNMFEGGHSINSTLGNSYSYWRAPRAPNSDHPWVPKGVDHKGLLWSRLLGTKIVRGNLSTSPGFLFRPKVINL